MCIRDRCGKVMFFSFAFYWELGNKKTKNTNPRVKTVAKKGRNSVWVVVSKVSLWMIYFKMMRLLIYYFFYIHKQKWRKISLGILHTKAKTIIKILTLMSRKAIFFKKTNGDSIGKLNYNPFLLILCLLFSIKIKNTLTVYFSLK